MEKKAGMRFLIRERKDKVAACRTLANYIAVFARSYYQGQNQQRESIVTYDYCEVGNSKPPFAGIVDEVA